MVPTYVNVRLAANNRCIHIDFGRVWITVYPYNTVVFQVDEMMEYTIPYPSQPTICDFWIHSKNRRQRLSYGIHSPDFTRLVHLSDPARIKRRDAKLWKRKIDNLCSNGGTQMRCPCSACGIRSVSNFGPWKVLDHLSEFGRHPARRVWNGPDRDQSDDEWSAAMDDGIACRQGEYWNRREEASEVHGVTSQDRSDTNAPLDQEVDIARMVQEIFQDLDSLQAEAAQENDEELIDRDQDDDMDEHLNTTSEPLFEDFEWPQAIEDASRPLYEGASTSKLGFTMMFLNICGQHNVPNVCVTELLSLVSKLVLPKDNIAPWSHYEAKSVVTTLGLNYEAIHACPKGHMLFRGQYANANKCHICQTSRYLKRGKSLVPALVLRHFPIAPRLLRMYRIQKIAELQTWTANN